MELNTIGMTTPVFLLQYCIKAERDLYVGKIKYDKIPIKLQDWILIKVKC